MRRARRRRPIYSRRQGYISEYHNAGSNWQTSACPSSYQRSMLGPYPRLDIVPELRRQRQHIGSLIAGHSSRGVVRDSVAFASICVELAHHCRINPNGVFQRRNSNCVVPGNIGVGAIPCGVQSRSCHGKGRIVRELKSSFRAQSANARVSEISIGQREQAGEFLCGRPVCLQRALCEPRFQAHLHLRSRTVSFRQ